MHKLNFGLLLTTLGLMACQTTPPNTTLSQKTPVINTLSKTKMAPEQEATFSRKQSSVSNMQLQNNTLTLKLHFPQNTAQDAKQEGFQTQSLNTAHIAFVKLTLVDSTGREYFAKGSDNQGFVANQQGQFSLSVSPIQKDPLIIATLEAFDDQKQPIPGAVLKTAFAHKDNSQSIELNYQSTALARVLEKVKAQNSTLAQNQLSTLPQKLLQLTGRQGQNGAFTYAHHPELLNIDTLAHDLLTQTGIELQAPQTYQQAGGKLTGSISGLKPGDTLKLHVEDNSSPVATLGNGPFHLEHVKPGTWKLTLSVNSGSYTLQGAPTEVQLTDAQTLDLGAIQALYNIPSVQQLSLAQGKVGDALTITGEGFVGTESVTFNGASSEFQVVNNNQIQVNIPAGATTGLVTVTNSQGSANSPAPLTVLDPVIFVKHDATGTADGSSWQNAYPSLQSALQAATANHQIWVAQGSYHPHDTDPSVSFELSNGVPLFGGFAGTEVELGQRSIHANPSILNGDLQNNDNGALTLTDPARSDNSHTVVLANGGRLDGFTIRGGNNNSQKNNGRGGGLHTLNQTIQLSNVTFQHNAAVQGGGLYIEGKTARTEFSRVVFEQNQATDGGGAYVKNLLDFTFSHAVFSQNQAETGGGLYIFANDLNHMDTTQNAPGILNNLLFEGNQATQKGGGVAYFLEGTIVGTGDFQTLFTYLGNLDSFLIRFSNMTFFNNTAPTEDGLTLQGNIFAPLNFHLYNSLFINDQAPANNIGNLVNNQTQDPHFVNENTPKGPDGLWLTADDGLRLQGSSPARNAGNVNQFNNTTDILGLPRNQENATDVGAYEYQP